MSLNKSHSFWKDQQDKSYNAYKKNLIYPNRYVFVLTNLCNLRCEFCFQSREKRSDAMKEKDWLNLIDQIPKDSRITLTGGEPFVFKSFNNIFSEVVKDKDCNIISNGTLLKPELVEFIIKAERLKILSISIDEIYNKNRGVTNDQWKRMLEGIKFFHNLKIKRKNNISLDIKVVIMDENSNHLFELHKYAIEQLGADTVSYSFLKGSEIQHSDYEFSYDCIYKQYKAKKYEQFEIIIEQLEKIRDYNKNNNAYAFLHPNIFDLNTSEGKIDINYINNIFHEKKHYKPCISPWGSIHVNVDGNVFPCMSISVGNVKTEKLENILKGDKFFNFKEYIKKEGTVSACNRCGYLKPAVNLSAD